MPNHTHARRETPSQTLAGRRQAPAGQRQAETPTHSSPAARHVAQLQSRLDASPRVQAVQRVAQRVGEGEGEDKDKDKGGSSTWFSRNIFGPHSYKVRHRANTRRPEESEEETTRRTYESLKGRPAPGAFGRSSSDEGRSLTLFPFGRIFTRSNPEDSSVTNETRAPHLFHRGHVTRRAIGEDIESEGGGTGPLPSLNSGAAEWLWGNQAFRLRLQNDPEFALDFRRQTWKEFEDSGLNFPS